MSRSVRIALIAAALPVILVIWGTVVFAMDRASNGGEILGEVVIGGVDVSGLDQEEALKQIMLLEYELATTPFQVEVEDMTFELAPYTIGYDLDEEAMLEAALQNGREGGVTEQFRWWLGNLGGQERVDVPIIVTYERSLLEDLLEYWETAAVDDPPFEGGFRVENGEILAEYPRAGTGIDVPAGVAAVEAVLFGYDRPNITVPTDTRVPTTPVGIIDGAVDEAEALVDGPVVLSRTIPSIRVEFPQEVLAAAVRSRQVTDENDDIAFEIYFDPAPFRSYIEPIRTEIEVPPVNAQIVIRPDETVTIIPGRNGSIVDEDAVLAAVTAAARSADRSGIFPFTDGAEPEFSTADAEEMGIRNLLYRAVTFFPAGGPQKNLNRIHNIQRIAEEVDGAIVAPGEVFSLNAYVGQRTLDDGYASAGAIIGDEVYCCDHPANIGGGVSQFTTTLYNAVFWSGLEDVEHTPHTLYFPRYPMGREATLGWPTPDLKFRNDTDYSILIDTDSTDTSVTVRFYGDNGGRDIEGTLSDQRFFTEPEDKYKPDENIPPGEEEVDDEGQPGFTVTVFRTITYLDGSTKEEFWDWRYDPFPRIILVHPCELPEDAEDYEEIGDVPCPIMVPDVLGLPLAEATTALNNAGIFIAVGEPFLVTDPALVGTVRTQDPAPEEWIDLEETVTVRVGQLDPNATTTTTTQP